MPDAAMDPTPSPVHGLLDPERVDKLSVPNGRVYPWQKNLHRCICQSCRRENIPAGEAVRFMRGYNWHGGSNGYYCRECVAVILEACDWHWNPITEELYPRQQYTQHPVRGADLAGAFRQEGEPGMFRVLMERNRK